MSDVEGAVDDGDTDDATADAPLADDANDDAAADAPTADPTDDAPVAALASLRANPTRRRSAAVVGAAVGLAVAQVHWLGFLLGGALVGLAAPTLRRALAHGLAFGLLGLALFVAVLAGAGALGSYVATGQLFYVGAAVPVVGGLVGSLARGVA